MRAVPVDPSWPRRLGEVAIRSRIIYLYEVLSRIELPPEADRLDAMAYTGTGDEIKADLGQW